MQCYAFGKIRKLPITKTTNIVLKYSFCLFVVVFNKGCSCLHVAVQHSQIGAVAYLIAKGMVCHLPILYSTVMFMCSVSFYNYIYLLENLIAELWWPFGSPSGAP